ncbi:MAG: efflux RND transporter periplasmic adaptor subunit [Bacteroidota bacterium]|nr:efflux RND transporter periplasmic adaptor subunit [Bacteroidota bacterium]
MLNRIKYLGLMIILAVSVLSFVSTGCKKKEEVKGSLNFTENDTVAVKIVTAEVKDIQIVKTFSGSLEGKEQANVFSKVPERIVSLPIKVGSVVSKGALIIGLDKSGASSQYYQALAAFQNAGKDLDRMKSLLKEGAISQQMLDGVQTQYNVAKANLDGAKNAIDLTAPISGVVTALNVNIGDIAQPGAVLVTIASTGVMKSVFNVGEGDLTSMKNGQLCEIFSDLKPELKLKGKVTSVNTSADVTSRTFKIEAEFGNSSDKFFKPGMFSRNNVQLKNQKGTVVIPNEAIVFENNRTVIYVVDAKNIAHQREVKIGISDGKITEILSGVNNGEYVVTLGMNNLKEGKFVYISK